MPWYALLCMVMPLLSNVQVFFYQAAHEELKAYRPLLKFMCIKFIIFFSYWQGLAVALLVTVGWIPPYKVLHLTCSAV
jgi:hypothetical protein